MANEPIEKIYEDVQLHIAFSQAASRSNIVTYDSTSQEPENISTAFGKLSKWYEALVPTGGSSGKILAWNSSGTAKWSDPLHPTITKSADTTSTASPAHGGTFTTVDSVTRDANGHVTKINTKTITLPADSNTDTKVRQSQTTTTNYRPILFGAKNSTDVSTLADTITDEAYTSTKMYAQPQDGILYANRMYLKDPGSKGQLNLLTSKYNVMLRNDDANTYFLVTAQNDPTGTWTSARPLTINNSTGVCSINGNAATSSSWATSKTLTLDGQLSGSVSVKGDANMTLSGYLKNSFICDENEDFASYAWHKFAETTISVDNGDRSITFIVSKSWGDVPRCSGILTAHIRTGATKVHESSQFYWQLANSEIDPANFVFVYTNTTNTSCKVELWYKQTSRWDGWIFTVLKEHSRLSRDNTWTLYTSTGHGSASHTTGTDSYASSIAGIKNNTSGTSSNVTGTVAIAHGGTGATDRLNALKNLTNENVGTNAQYFLTITNSWGKGGYTSVAQAKTVLGIGATTSSGTLKHLAYYNGANSITDAGNIIYSVEDSTKSRSRTILHLVGTHTVGNEATQLVGGVRGVLSYGDGGPQINFSTGATIGGAQDSSIIWTDNDAAGYGASWHFVSNQPDWTVVSKRFHARTGISIGTDVPPVVSSTTATNYSENLYVAGTSKFTYSDFGPIHIVRSGSTWAAGIKFSNSNGLIGAIGMTGDVDTALIRWKSDLSTSYTILDSGNYTSYALASTTKYAASSSVGGPATYVELPRVTADAKSFPGQNKVGFKEYSNTSTNTPSSAWYHIISMQGADTMYGTQLALGMTTNAVYYRNYTNGSTWINWQPLGRFTATPTSGQVVITDGTTGGVKSSGYTIAKSVPSNALFTDTTYSANNGVGLSGTTFYNSGVRAVSTGSANGTISVNTNGTSADVAVKGLASAAYVTQESLLRARSSVTTDGGATGWSQIGINQYNNAYPDGVTNKIYSYGAVVSMPAPNARFDLYYNHNSSTAGAITNGLQYRTGWDNDKKVWKMLLDNDNYGSYMTYTSNRSGYASSDTHILQLGYFVTDGLYDNCTILVSSAFWGNQHGSSDIINYQQSNNTNDTAAIHVTMSRIRIGGSVDRTFYYKADNANNRVYLYVHVIGGNSYGRWNTTVLQSSGLTTYWRQSMSENQANSGLTAIAYTGAVAVVDRNTTAGLTTSGIQYAVGQLTIGSADGNAKEGSNASYKLWSYPAGGTGVSSTVANIQNLRLYWSASYYRDIFISPNNYDIYHRAVENNNARDWRKILDSGNYTSYALASTTKYAASSSVGGPALSVSTAGGDVVLGTPNSSSDDSGDIVWNYGNGKEKARLWQDNTYTAKAGPSYRIFKSDGTGLYSGRLPLADGTSASGTWGISITGNATSANALNLTHGNELNFSKLASTGHVWIGYRWNTQGTETSGGTTITTYKFGNANGAGGLAGLEATTSTFKSGNFGDQLIVERTGGANMAGIAFKNTSGVLGYIAANTVDGDLYHYGATDPSTMQYTILDSHNYTSYPLPRNIKHIHTASGTQGSAGWVKIARITVTAAYANHPMTFTIAQRGVMQYRIHLVLVNNGSVAAAAISEFIIARDNSWTDTNNNPRAYIIKPSDGIFDLYIRKTEAYDHIFVVDFTKADDSEGNNYSVTWTNVHAADSAITGGTEAVKKLYLPSTTNYAGSSSVGGAATSANKLNTNAGATNRPVYFSGGVPVQCDAPGSGSWFKGVPLIGTDGVMEIGRMIDFHSTNTSTADYDLRLQYTGTATGKTITLPGASGNVALLAKGGTSYYGMLDGDGSASGWIRATSNGFIPSAGAKFFQTATSSLGTSSWYFKNSYIQYMTANSLVLGAAKTADGAQKGQLKFFSGNSSDATGTVTLECIDDANRTGDYTVKLPTCNGTIPVFEKLFQGASNTVSLSYSDIEEYDLFLITVANSNASSEPVTVTSLWISNVAGIHDMPLIWGGAPTSSGGACNVTSGWIQLSKNSGTTTFVVAHKPSVAQMTSSGWTISSPTYNLYIRKIFGLKTYKRT